MFILRFFSVDDLLWTSSLNIAGLNGKDGPAAEHITTGQNILSDIRELEMQSDWQFSVADEDSPYPKGRTKSPGNKYSKCLVITKMKTEDTDWVEEQLGDMIIEDTLTTAVYVVDDRRAKLHPPKNKGHEVMVYLSYIIDHYDTLADVNIFMHSHRLSWHNNEVLDRDAVQMVRHLSPDRVVREGYVNLRCHWDPGCPTWLYPENTKLNSSKQEEVLLASAWPQLFPSDPLPMVLAQPCCAQFAVSRERIRQTDKTRYIQLREWLIRTDISDFLSGRIFEYVWQFIFNHVPIYCPTQSSCYCDGYGLCFGGEAAFEDWMEMWWIRDEYQEQLTIWEEKNELFTVWKNREKGGKTLGASKPAAPVVGEDQKWRDKIAGIEEKLNHRRQMAFELGRDPKQRALEAGREWKQGDGY